MPEHPIHTHLSPGMRIVVPLVVEHATWADLREIVALGQHYPDDADVEWDMNSRDVLGPEYGPDGVIIRRAGDLDG